MVLGGTGTSDLERLTRRGWARDWLCLPGFRFSGFGDVLAVVAVIGLCVMVVMEEYP